LARIVEADYVTVPVTMQFDAATANIQERTATRGDACQQWKRRCAIAAQKFELKKAAHSADPHPLLKQRGCGGAFSRHQLPKRRSQQINNAAFQVGQQGRRLSRQMMPPA